MPDVYQDAPAGNPVTAALIGAGQGYIKGRDRRRNERRQDRADARQDEMLDYRRDALDAQSAARATTAAAAAEKAAMQQKQRAMDTVARAGISVGNGGMEPLQHNSIATTLLSAAGFDESQITPLLFKQEPNGEWSNALGARYRGTQAKDDATKAKDLGAAISGFYGPNGVGVLPHEAQPGYVRSQNTVFKSLGGQEVPVPGEDAYGEFPQQGPVLPGMVLPPVRNKTGAKNPYFEPNAVQGSQIGLRGAQETYLTGPKTANTQAATGLANAQTGYITGAKTTNTNASTANLESQAKYRDTVQTNLGNLTAQFKAIQNAAAPDTFRLANDLRRAQAEVARTMATGIQPGQNLSSLSTQLTQSQITKRDANDAKTKALGLLAELPTPDENGDYYVPDPANAGKTVKANAQQKKYLDDRRGVYDSIVKAADYNINQAGNIGGAALKEIKRLRGQAAPAAGGTGGYAKSQSVMPISAVVPAASMGALPRLPDNGYVAPHHSMRQPRTREGLFNGPPRKPPAAKPTPSKVNTLTRHYSHDELAAMARKRGLKVR